MGKLKRSHRIPPFTDKNEKINNGTPEVFQNGNPNSFLGKGANVILGLSQQGRVPKTKASLAMLTPGANSPAVSPP
jgi:hypothetical protein